MAPIVRKSRASSPAIRESEATEMVNQESEYMNAGKENCPISAVENVEKVVSEELSKGNPVTKPVEEAVARKESQWGYKILGAIVIILFIVLAISMMTFGSNFGVTAKQATTASDIKMFNKDDSLHDQKEFRLRDVSVIVAPGAIGSLAHLIKRRKQAKKDA